LRWRDQPATRYIVPQLRTARGRRHANRGRRVSEALVKLRVSRSGSTTSN
jgi:hypothetical protein